MRLPIYLRETIFFLKCHLRNSTRESFVLISQPSGLRLLDAGIGL